MMAALFAAVTLYWHLLALVLAATVGEIIVCLCLRVPIKEVVVFSGKPLCRFSLYGLPIVIQRSPWPYAHALIYSEKADDPEMPNDWRHLSTAKRFLTRRGDLIAFTLIGIIFLGGPAFLHSALTGFVQFIGGALSPLDLGATYLRRFMQLESSDFWVATGILAAKFWGYQFIPFPGTIAGDVLAVSERFRKGSGCIPGLYAFGFLGFLGSWFTALLAALYSVSAGGH